MRLILTSEDEDFEAIFSLKLSDWNCVIIETSRWNLTDFDCILGVNKDDDWQWVDLTDKAERDDGRGQEVAESEGIEEDEETNWSEIKGCLLQEDEEKENTIIKMITSLKLRLWEDRRWVHI